MAGLLKFITCGSVDDGKSTLIGHLLYDAKLLYADQKEALVLDSKVGSRGGAIDYSLLLDGLMAEREQGITIDVAYRYFTTDRRSFICADTPGHEEYTRNMACGASFADLAVILVDARKGVLTQTRRHARICALMGIRFFVFAINKMDLVGYREDVFRKIEADIQQLQKELALQNVVLIPVSATEGDNITQRSAHLPWYHGEALLPYLETVDVDSAAAQEQGFVLPVQRVSRPSLDFRGFQGQVESGGIHIGETVTALPSGETAEVKRLLVAGKDVQEVTQGQPVTMTLTREIDVSRGSVLTKQSGLQIADTFQAEILWMDDTELTAGKNFLVRLGTKKLPAIVTDIAYRIDVNTGAHEKVQTLAKNALAVCTLAVTEPIVLDTFARHRTMGSFILIDRISNMTSACGTVLAIGGAKRNLQATPKMRAALNWQVPLVVAFRPQSDGTTLETIAEAEFLLVRASRHTYFYQPTQGEDYQKTVRHLRDAGLVVLLVLNENEPLPTEAIPWAEIAHIEKPTGRDIAQALLARTMFESMIAQDNWVI